MTDYAGDITPQHAWEALQSMPNAKLVDVRTQAEWNYVGIPDLTQLEKQPILVSWQVYPNMTLNADFADQLRAHGVGPEDEVLLLCRSGVRSKAAAQLLTSLGFKAAYNIADGFEGGLDQTRQRGKLAGWKAAGLPWTQG